MRDRRSLPRMEFIGLELGLGAAWFSVHARAQHSAMLSYHPQLGSVFFLQYNSTDQI